MEAQYQLAIRYETGAWGVRQHPDQALYWFNKAAESGYKPAMRSLADIYEKGLLGRETGSETRRAIARES